MAMDERDKLLAKEQLNNTRILFLFLGYILGVFNTIIVVSIIYNGSTTMEKAQAIVGCKNHNGVDKVQYTYAVCQDGYKSDLNLQGELVYEVYKRVSERTILNVTLADWKNVEFEKPNVTK